jgi:hypothetical protein
MVKIKPILFSTDMVKSIINGIKTKTRRTKGLEDLLESKYVYQGIPDGLSNTHVFARMWKGHWVETIHKFCPYGNVGDILWVRETFREIEQDYGEPRYEYKSIEKINLSDKWKPSIFMPKKACIIFLQIKSVTVERLQDISESDAIAEGIEMTWIHNDIKQCMFKNYINHGRGSLYPIESFKSLWESINGKGSIDSNPWVWVIEFEKIEKPDNFI